MRTNSTPTTPALAMTIQGFAQEQYGAKNLWIVSCEKNWRKKKILDGGGDTNGSVHNVERGGARDSVDLIEDV